MEQSVTRINSLLHGNEKELVDCVKDQLSNVFGGGKKFQANSIPETKNMFNVYKCQAISLLDMLKT